ncbi:MAG: DUF4349 domain-containing protein [Cellulomonas sp.]|nr:DUF4349 domain-containing protein [Cellulomonas sp.]
MRLVGLLATVAVLTAGCSAESGSSSQADGAVGTVVQDSAAQAPEEAAAQDAGAADPAALSATATDRQVITTGDLTLVTDRPATTVTEVVSLVERVGGRVDSRTETAATQDSPGSALVTARVPSDQVTATIDGLRELGTVSNLTLDAQDVTATAQDLDARIAAQRISVARMEDVLSRVTTTSDLVAVEDALRQRQSDLEAMVAERDRIADQVALSTLSIRLTAPSVVEPAGPGSFGTAVVAGWRSLVGALGSFALVLGVMLPWLVFLALLATPLVLLARQRRRRTLVAAASGAQDPAAPSSLAGAPSAPPYGPIGG